MAIMNELTNLDNWKEVTRGLYRYVLSVGACYEIHILYHYHKTPVLTAKASLFIVGDWRDKSGSNFFERECLLQEQPVQECLNEALSDYKENVK